ncbi:MAG: phosphoribosylamine--glycine ligase [Bacteroidales bacterium]|nr:phosphoribosylamine--glycine ligase [Bacteroidales bacterium]MBN2761633.1 phosphoribosylamine--glycine ligase [Bacteroidales bacterium]
MNILILGSGGREHALAWKTAQSPRVDKLYIAPGNAGTAQTGTNVNLAVNDFEKIGDFAVENRVDMIVVGPEDPLVKGIYDFFRQTTRLRHIHIIGPSKQGAQLEGSKDFAKAFMKRNNIPTAAYFPVTADTLEQGLAFLETQKPPYVLKADGLAAGKGVLIINNIEEAQNELRLMLEGKFGDASKKVVIEEYLSGIELSAFVVTDGVSYKMLPEAKDYKRIGEGDAGPNTGGMGAVSPVPFAGADFMKKVEDRIIRPTIEGIRQEKIDYRGFIFFGLMNCKGDPYVIEYNVRLGDPESEVILPRLRSDIVDLYAAVAGKNLHNVTVTIDPRAVTTVMLASGGYPGSYEKGKEITGLDKTDGSIIFHAGTKSADGKVLTNGGRVMAVSSVGDSFREALAVSNKNAAVIQFDKKYYRKDIGFDL